MNAPTMTMHSRRMVSDPESDSFDGFTAVFVTSPGAGMTQAALGRAVPAPRNRTKRESPCPPSSQWEAVAGVAYRPRVSSRPVQPEPIQRSVDRSGQ